MAKKEFTGINLTLPTARLVFPAVFEAKYNEMKKKEEWSVTMLYDKKTADLSKLKQTMVRAAKNEFGEDVDPKTLDLNRIIDGDTPNNKGGARHASFAGNYVVKAATRLKAPGVVDSQLNKIIDPTEIYSGVYANVNVTVKAYRGPQGDGVTLYLNHVQKIKDGEPIGGGPRETDVFEALDIDESEVETVNATDDMEGFFS